MSAPDANGWMPIETAPQTGRVVWLASVEPYRMTNGMWVDGFGWADDFNESTAKHTGVPFEPTHWQPYFPKPPVVTP